MLLPALLDRLLPLFKAGYERITVWAFGGAVTYCTDQPVLHLLVPAGAQLTPSVLLQISTPPPVLTPSLRASAIADTKVLIWAMSLSPLMVALKLGTAMVARIATTATSTRSSMSVKPLSPDIFRTTQIFPE